MTMLKPALKRTYDYSTAVTDLHYTGTFNTNRTPFSHSSTINLIHPTVSSFQIIPPVNNQISAVSRNQAKTLQPNQRQIDWTDTKDIQTIITRAIETDIEQSIERNFGIERYFFSTERVCAEKELPIPDQVKQILNEANQHPNDERSPVSYGYLSFANAVYYIIGQNLYVFRIQDLKKRDEKEIKNNEFSNRQLLMPVKLKQNCRKIHQVNFSDDLNSFSSLKMPSKKALILEYPYHLEIVNYKFEQKVSSSQEIHTMSIFSIINLGLNFSIDSERADFITITPCNTLLYIDEKGLLVNCMISRQDGKFKRKLIKQNPLSYKATFLSKSQGIMRKIKQIAFQTFPFSFSLQLAKRTNMALVYDESRSRVYTWTLKGDRSTAVQQLQKEINVYDFFPTQNGYITCILTIPEEQILREMDFPIDRPSVFVATILKVESDYNQQTNLIVLLSNGIKVYLQIIKDQCKFRWKCSAPSVENLKEKIYRKNNSLFEMDSLKTAKDSNIIITKKWGEKLDVESTKNLQQKMFSYFNDRSISIGLVRTDNRFGMYLTVRKNYQKSDFYDVFEVKFKNDFFNRRLESYPKKNQIFQTKCATLQTETSSKLAALEQYEEMEQMMSSTVYKPPKPTSEGSHELLRQVHHGPRFFTYLSNNFIANFSLVRPIDIVYYFVKFQREIFCQNYLPAIINVDNSEICYMLLQIYSAPQDTSFFISKKYIQKIDCILKQMHSKSDKINASGLMNPSKTYFNKQKKKIQLNESQNYDKLIQFKKEATNDQLNVNIRKLFANFSSQQKLINHNVFESIILKNSKKSTEDIDLDINMRNLSEEHKIQAKNCLVYISRVLYPFWNAKTLTMKKGELYLHTIKKKVQEFDEIVNLLKLQGNDYWHHLQNFLQKLHQMIEVFIWIPKLPYGLTLSEAMQKSVQYFEPFIFESIQYNYHPRLIEKFKQIFPLYITSEFNTLVKIYEFVAKSTKDKEINKNLQRLNSYPQYFINYLKRQKPSIDYTVLVVRDRHAQVQSEEIEMPVLPFVRLLSFYFEKIKSPTVKMAHKFQYLKLINQKLQQQKNPNQAGTQVVESQSVAKFQSQYEQSLKCLKLQEQCKEVIEEILQQEMTRDERKAGNKRENLGFLTQFFSKFTCFFSDEPQQKRENLSKTSYQMKRNVHESHRSIFQKLNYYSMTRKDFEGLLQYINNPYIKALYMSVFWNNHSKQAEIMKQMQVLEQNFKDIVRDGYNKFGNKLDAKRDDYKQRQRYKKIMSYVKNIVTKILSFLNSTRTELRMPALYDGITSEMTRHDLTLLQITEVSQGHEGTRSQAYSIPRHLVEQGFNKKQIFEYVFRNRLIPCFNSRVWEQSSEKQRLIKQWIYECCMLTDMVMMYKKQDTQRLIKLMQDFGKMYEQMMRDNNLIAFGTALETRKNKLQSMLNESDVII